MRSSCPGYEQVDIVTEAADPALRQSRSSSTPVAERRATPMHSSAGLSVDRRDLHAAAAIAGWRQRYDPRTTPRIVRRLAEYLCLGRDRARSCRLRILVGRRRAQPQLAGARSPDPGDPARRRPVAAPVTHLLGAASGPVAERHDDADRRAPTARAASASAYAAFSRSAATSTPSSRPGSRACATRSTSSCRRATTTHPAVPAPATTCVDLIDFLDPDARQRRIPPSLPPAPRPAGAPAEAVPASSASTRLRGPSLPVRPAGQAGQACGLAADDLGQRAERLAAVADRVLLGRGQLGVGAGLRRRGTKIGS